MQGEVHGTDADGDGAFRLLAGAQGGLLGPPGQDDGLSARPHIRVCRPFTVSLASGKKFICGVPMKPRDKQVIRMVEDLLRGCRSAG